VPLTKGQTLRVLLRTHLPWRRLRPERVVRRQVQGVSLELPWSHLLPDYARVVPGYGQNLVALAQGLSAEGDGPLQVLDVGANVGDSAKQVVAATRARVLCVEGDPYWAGFLHRNVDGLPDVEVEEALLVGEAADEGDLAPVRRGGTTRFEAGAPGALPALTVPTLLARHPSFDHVRLVKSDTDGFDTVLVPAVARALAASRPVLFFEFDPGLTRRTGADPDRLWADLAELGYSRLVVWDNLGEPLHRLDVADAAERARSLEPPPVHLGYHYWDVAAVHDDDPVGARVLEGLVPPAARVGG
jgi:FkbM family methyltransferase